MKYCSNCGNQLEDSANFCSKCGTKVSNIETNLSENQIPSVEKTNGTGEKVKAVVTGAVSKVGGFITDVKSSIRTNNFANEEVFKHSVAVDLKSNSSIDKIVIDNMTRFPLKKVKCYINGTLFGMLDSVRSNHADSIGKFGNNYVTDRFNSKIFNNFEIELDVPGVDFSINGYYVKNSDLYITLDDI